MTGAMYAAVSGLKTHMNKLNVIGNNISNVNTYGYKSSRMTFEESIYATTRGGSNGTVSSGGRNPAQIGYGAQVSTIDLNMSSGTYAPTGYAMDCMIDGNGFFLVGDKETADIIDVTDPESVKSLQLTRVGDLSFDAKGYLVDGNGNVVYGFLTAMTKAGEGAADPDAMVAKTSTNLVPIRLPMARGDNGATAYPEVEDGKIKDAESVTFAEAGAGADVTVNCDNRVKVDSIGIDGTTGKITAINQDTDEQVAVGYLALGQVSNPNGVTHVGGRYYKAMEGAGDLRIASLGGAVEGYLQGYEAPTDGTPATADPLMQIVNGGATELLTGGLELSTTDLATEMTEMITTQRGYQANSRIITVTDSMLEELVNIKR